MKYDALVTCDLCRITTVIAIFKAPRCTTTTHKWQCRKCMSSYSIKARLLKHGGKSLRIHQVMLNKGPDTKPLVPISEPEED